LSAAAIHGHTVTRVEDNMLKARLVFTASTLIGTAAALGLAHAAPANNYHVTVLVSDQPGVAPVTDAKLVNGWGIAASATSPWWVSDNGTDTSTLYTGAGLKNSLEVSVPGAPTGIVAYAGTQFLLASTPAPRPSRFLWATEDGHILGWNPQFDMTHAHIVFTGLGAIYKGLAVVGNTLYATDFANCEVTAINGSFAEFGTAGGFEDSSIPKNYCPFGIQAIAGSLFVTYALRGGDDDIAGVSHGFVRQFDTEGNLVARVASHGTLNSPWGLAMAPSDFGAFGGCLLVGNFGDGLINAYCEDTQGEFRPRGRLQHNGEIRIDGLWGIGFGNGAASGPTNVLYFAAGPNDESNGTFGKIEFAR